jgi:hypothetical protein
MDQSFDCQQYLLRINLIGDREILNQTKFGMDSISTPSDQSVQFSSESEKSNQFELDWKFPKRKRDPDDDDNVVKKKMEVTSSGHDEVSSLDDVLTKLIQEKANEPDLGFPSYGEFGDNFPYRGRDNVSNQIIKHFCKVINQHVNRLETSQLLYLTGAPGTGKTRTCKELVNVLGEFAAKSNSLEMKLHVKNSVHVHVMYNSVSPPAERDAEPLYGLAWRIIKSFDLTVGDIVKGQDLLDSVFTTIATKKKNKERVKGPILITLCIDDYDRLISYFNQRGSDYIKELTNGVGACMENRNYVLFPIFSGTLEVSSICRDNVGSFFPGQSLYTGLLSLDLCDAVILELSKIYSYTFLTRYVGPDGRHKEVTGFRRLVRAVGGHLRSLELLIDFCSRIGRFGAFSYTSVFSDITFMLKFRYKVDRVSSSNELIEAYILRTPVTRQTTLRLSPTKEESLHELESKGMIFLTGDFEDDKQFIVDFPYAWFKILVDQYDLTSDTIVHPLLKAICTLMDKESITSREMEKLNFFLLIIKITYQNLRNRKTFSLKTIYRGAHFCNPKFDLQFDTPSIIKTVELVTNYPFDPQIIQENAIYFNCLNANFCSVFYNSAESDFFEHTYYYPRNHQDVTGRVIATYRIATETLKRHMVTTGKARKYALVYMGNGRIKPYPTFDNYLIVSTNEYLNYYGLALGPIISLIGMIGMDD